MFFEIVAQAIDLLAAVFLRNRNQYWLVKTAADHFQLIALLQATQKIEIFRMCIFDPFEQAARQMQSEANLGMLIEQFDEWKIAVGVCALDYVVKIADRLMSVNKKD